MFPIYLGRYYVLGISEINQYFLQLFGAKWLCYVIYMVCVKWFFNSLYVVNISNSSNQCNSEQLRLILFLLLLFWLLLSSLFFRSNPQILITNLASFALTGWFGPYCSRRPLTWIVPVLLLHDSWLPFGPCLPLSFWLFTLPLWLPLWSPEKNGTISKE